MAYTLSPATPAYGNLGGPVGGVLLNSAIPFGTIGSNFFVNYASNISASGASLNLSYATNVGGTTNQFDATAPFGFAPISSGLHEFYVAPDVLETSTGLSNAATFGLFYVDSSNVGHNAAVGAYAAATNSFTVTLPASTTDGAYGNGTFTVTNGAFTTTASLSGQTVVGGVDTLTYTLAAQPTGGSFNVYATGYDVVRDGLSTTATIIVPSQASSPVTTATPQTVSQQAGYALQTVNLLGATAGDPSLSDPNSPIYAQQQSAQAIAAKLDAGQISAADAQNALLHLVDGTTSVAELSYAFFTGQTPTAAGLSYLVHSSSNPNDLNDSYYAQFTTENRYINFAANLATGQGAGAQAFQASYGSLSLSDAAAKAYQAVFGITPSADKISAILNAQVSDGHGGLETRAQYLADITGGSSLAQKAAVVGFLLADSVKEGFGAYQQADLHFLQDLAHGAPAYNVDLLAAYTQAPTLVGQPSTAQNGG